MRNHFISTPKADFTVINTKKTQQGKVSSEQVFKNAGKKQSLLLGWHLSHTDPDADDLTSLHSHGAGTLTTTAGTDTPGGVESRGRGVFSARAPRPRLPVVNCTGMFVTVPYLLEGTAVWAQDAT